MKGKIIFLVIVVSFLGTSMITNVVQPISAEPEEISLGKLCLPGTPCQFIDGNYSLPLGETQNIHVNNEINSSAGPDEYGYEWDDSVVYDWVDITSGTSTDFNSIWNISERISLPFTFPYYENSYSHIYITAPGYLTFTESVDPYGGILDGWSPHNIIAPFWSFFDYSMSSSLGNVYYQFFGTEPNRYFIAQWDQIQNSNGDIFTFQAVLYENGDIKFQYHEIPTSKYYPASVGIEDSKGLDGLVYLNASNDYPSQEKAVYFTRPEPSVRLRVDPSYLGEFIYPNKTIEFIFTVQNRGDLGTDVFDLDATIQSSWTLNFFDANTGVPLNDTNMNGMVDTGEIQPEASKEVLIKITSPQSLSVGATYLSSVEVSSSLDPTKTTVVTVETTVPNAFTQSYNESNQNRLDLIWSEAQLNVELGLGNDAKVIETPDHNFIVMWTTNVTMPDGGTGNLLHYAALNRIGKITQPPKILMEPSGYANYHINDAGTIAVAPDGSVGILWSRYLLSPEEEINSNVWFIQLDSLGETASTPINLTNNTVWYPRDDDYLSFGRTRITSTADNHYLLVWERSFGYLLKDSQADLYYSIRSTNGEIVLEPTNMTVDHPGASLHDRIAIAGLSGNRFIVTYVRIQFINNMGVFFLLYREFDSEGNQLSPYQGFDAYVDDITQFSNGNILLAGSFYTGEKWEEGYRLVDGESFEILFSSPAGALFHPASTQRVDDVFVTKNNQGRAAITWTDINGKYIYYVEVDENGTIISGPSIARTAGKDKSINIGQEGYSSTTNTWQPPNGVDLLASLTQISYNRRSDNVAEIELSYANQGLITATNSQLRLILDEGMTYVEDTFSIIPTIEDLTITWDLHELAFAEGEQFSVIVSFPIDVFIGKTYTVTLQISSDEIDTDPSNNTITSELELENPQFMLFLPVILK